MSKSKLRIISVLPVLCMLFVSTIAQPPTWTFEPFGSEKKPEKFETRKLGSEKTADKKFQTSPQNYSRWRVRIIIIISMPTIN